MLKFRVVSRVNVYSCPSEIEYINSVDGTKIVKSHYEVEFDDRISIQHITVLPYCIDTYGSKTEPMQSRIYKLYNNRWRHIKEVPRIKEDTEENLLKRIANILPFV